MGISNAGNKLKERLTEQLMEDLHEVLRTYSNVHRGSGHNSMVTTHLYEKARDIVLDYAGLDKKRHSVVFCSPYRAAVFTQLLKPGTYTLLSSLETGLALGVRALIVKKKALPARIPYHTGGGTTRLYSDNWVIWANPPERYEAGTPAIVNVIAFAKALMVIRQHGKAVFQVIRMGPIPAREILYHGALEKFSGMELLRKVRQSLVGGDVLVPTEKGEKPFINFDNSASTPTFEPVWQTFSQTLLAPASAKQELVQEVKAICAGVLDAPPEDYEVIFTSNTTESIGLVAESLAQENHGNTEPVVLNTLLEHSSNDLPWRTVPDHSILRLPTDKEGYWDLTELEQILADHNEKQLHGRKRITVVAVSGASNVLGLCNDLSETSRLAHRYGARLLVDGAQLVAHRKVRMKETGIDYLAFSAHKVYAPFGCGVLVVKKGILKLSEEKMSLARSSGEENAAGIAALGKSLQLLQRIGFDLIAAEEESMTRHLLRGMNAIPGLKIHGIKDPDSPAISQKVGVVVFDIKNMMSGSIAAKLAWQRGIGIRYGCHCAHLIVKFLSGFTPFMEQLQRMVVFLVPALTLQGFARVSIGLENTPADVDALLEEVARIARKAENKGKTPAASKNTGGQGLKKKSIRKLMNAYAEERALKVFGSNEGS
jgi:selenocysteine lyase/cysteine desulfurase